MNSVLWQIVLELGKKFLAWLRRDRTKKEEVVEVMTEAGQPMTDENMRAFEYYLLHAQLPPGFLGLDGAPMNNREFYFEREKFARWAAENHGVGKHCDRMPISKFTLVKRLGLAAKARGLSLGDLKVLLGIMMAESGIRNCGFGRDRHGSSLACGPMQTKWAAVMDGGYPYEGYLDIITDRGPLIGVDAGVGYYLRLAQGNPELSPADWIAKYNHPQKTALSNQEYVHAVHTAMKGSGFDEHLLLAEGILGSV